MEYESQTDNLAALGFGSGARLQPQGLSQLTGRVEAALGRARSIRDTLANATDSLFGPQPPIGNVVHDSAPSPVKADTLTSLVDDLHSVLTSIENYANRL